MFVPLVWYGLVEGKKLGFWSRLLDSTLTRVHICICMTSSFFQILCCGRRKKRFKAWVVHVMHWEEL